MIHIEQERQIRSIEALQQGIEQIRRGINMLLDCGADGWEQAYREAPAVYRELELQRNRLALVDTDFLVGSRDVRPISEHKQVQWFVRELPITAATARDRIRAAERLNHHPDPTTITSTCPEGVPHKTFMPEVRSAVAEGTLGNAGVAKIHKAIDVLPGKHHKEITRAADKPLADLVRQHGPVALNGLSVQLTQLFNLEDRYCDEDRQRKRRLRLGKQEYDGMSRLNGLVTPRLAAVIKRLFADHAKAGDLADRMVHADPATPHSSKTQKHRAHHGTQPYIFNATTDPRTPEQRAHDALEAAIVGGFSREAVKDIARDHEQPTTAETTAETTVSPSHGAVDESSFEDEKAEEREGSSRLFDVSTYEPDLSHTPQLLNPRWPGTSRLKPRRGTTTIVAVTSLEELLAGKGNAVTDAGVQISVESLVEGTNCSDVYLQLLDLTGQTLYLGRSQRLGSLAQYLALCAEEGGSSAPGTSAPPAWCDVHHITAWSHGGNTDLPNLTLVDQHTHANTVDTLGSEIDLNAPDTKWQSKPGRIEEGTRVRWYPPVSRDPARKPTENLNIAAQTTKSARLRRRRRAELRKTPAADPSDSSTSDKRDHPDPVA